MFMVFINELISTAACSVRRKNRTQQRILNLYVVYSWVFTIVDNTILCLTYLKLVMFRLLLVLFITTAIY